MAITKPTLTDGVTDFPETTAIFACGELYVADGGYGDSELPSSFAGIDLAASFAKLSDLAEKPFKVESKVTSFKTLNYTLEAKRNNVIELNLVGLTQARKAWLEEELGKANRTFVLVNKTKDSAMIFNDRRWICEWTYEAESAFNAMIKTEYLGPTATGFIVV